MDELPWNKNNIMFVQWSLIYNSLPVNNAYLNEYYIYIAPSPGLTVSSPQCGDVLHRVVCCRREGTFLLKLPNNTTTNGVNTHCNAEGGWQCVDLMIGNDGNKPSTEWGQLH